MFFFNLVLAWLHLIALGLGLGAVLARGASLRELPATAGSLRRVFRYDIMWAVAALLWVSTGLTRWFGPFDKPTLYYLKNGLFHAKLTLVVIVFVMEVWPMLWLAQWRTALRRGGSPEAVALTGQAKRIALISHVQATLIVIIVFLAVAMARGVGSRM